MRPVDQTTFGFPGGNCFSACVATLLEIELDDVPYFMADDEWFRRLERWLEPRGLWPVSFKLDNAWRPSGLHILSGKSPREPENPDALHSVVARGDRVVHDPHPSRGGLLSRLDVVLFIPFDPARAVTAQNREDLVSYFNEDQQEHLRYLAGIPAERRCWSGWCLLPDRRDCSSPKPCPPDASLADRLRTEQPCCGRPASRPDESRTSGSHYAGCQPEHRDAFATELGLIDLGGEA